LDAGVLVAVSPEVLVVAAEYAAAQGENGVSAVHGSVHARALEASGHSAAACLDHSGAHAQTLCTELWIAHAAAVLVDVVGALGSFLAAVSVSPQAVDAALLEVVAAGIRPRLVLRLVAAEGCLGQVLKFRCAVPRHALEVPHHLEKSASAHDLAAHNGLGSKRSKE